MPCCQTISGVQKRPRQAQLGRVRRAAPRAASRAVAHPVSRVIECACSRDTSAIPALPLAVVRSRLSWSATEAVSRCWQRAAKSAAPETPNVRFATQDLRHQRGGSGSCSRQRRKLERIASAMAVYGIRLSKIVRADGGSLRGGAMHGRGQTARDLRQSCRSVLIRRAKTAARLSERLSLFGGDRRHAESTSRG